MKKKLLFFFLFLTSVCFLSAQITYKDVASVFYARCTSCHHEGASHHPFMNYTQTAGVSINIQNNLISGKMPPWNADTSYTRFQHERIITSSEKQLILDWIYTGSQKGDTTQAPAAPVYPSQFQYQLQGNADLTLGIGTFSSTATFADKYYCFSIPTGLTQDRILRAFELVPGNKAIVHHAVITADTLGNYQSDLSGNCYNVAGNLGIGTYAPGSRATIFPSQAPLKAGMFIKAGSKIIIQLHYPSGSSGQVDSTKIRLFFYPAGTTGVRRIYSTTPLQNWLMAIPANSVVPYSAWFPSATVGLQQSISAFAVMPHSHLLCKSIIYYAVNPGIDTIPLVRINNWNFEWQDYFTFKKLVKIPNGYKLYSKHVFDNTSNNLNNPNVPPIMVFSNTGTNDEMLFDGMMYLDYEPGDELIDIESIINNDPLLNVEESNLNKNLLTGFAYPNPFNNRVTLQYTIKQPAEVNIEITDIIGRKIVSFNIGKQQEGNHTMEWNGKDSNGNKTSAGVYFYKITANNTSFKTKLMKQD